MGKETLVESHLITSVADLQSWVDDLKHEIQHQQIILLEGAMGVGKTQFTRCLVSSLGSEEAASPSYAILNHYETNWGDVEHLDLYRLEDEEDLESTGFWDLFANPTSLIIVEWADRLDQSMLPPNWIKWKVRLSFKENFRLIERFEYE